MSKEQGVREASARFYAALTSMANGDPRPMGEAWSTHADASAQHPIGGREVGSKAVLGSFAKVAELCSGGNVALSEQRLDIGEDFALETGVETGTVTIAGHTAAIEHRVSNVYRLEEGRWKIKHHHTDLSPAMLDILATLGAASG